MLAGLQNISNCYQMQRMATEQLLLRVSPELVRRYTEAAARYGAKSRNQVLEEVLETYLRFWEEVEEIKREAVEQQFKQLRKLPEKRRAG